MTEIPEIPTLITQDYMLGTMLYIRDSLEGIRSIMRDEPDTMHVDLLLQQVRREIERLES